MLVMLCALCKSSPDISEEINVNKTSTSKECDIYQYCYFLDKEFQFQPYNFNSFRDGLMIYVNCNNVATLNVLIIVVSLTKLAERMM